MASASWRRHFSVDEGLDKHPALQIKRPQFDDPSKRPNLNIREPRVTPVTNSGYVSDGNRSGFHTNRSRDLSEEIHLPSRLRALSDDISDVSASRYSGGDEHESGEECSNNSRKLSGDAWRSKYDSNYDRSYKQPRFSDGHTGNGPTRHQESWGFMDADDYSGITPSISNSASYPDFDGATSSTSGSLFSPPRHKNGRSSSNSRMSSTLDFNPRRKGNQQHRMDDPNGTRTSGYNTYSEMSDFTNYNKSKDQRNFKALPAPHKRDGSLDNDTYARRKARDDHYARRGSGTIDNRMASGGLYSRSMSANDSDISLSSKDRSNKSNEKEKRGSSQSLSDSRNHFNESKTQKVPSIGNVSVTVTNNIQYDPNDPFSFIQPIDLPFHKKVRKCMGPIAAVILLLILAAALGAAIYFASELKETQEKQIDLLRANLAMKIRNTDIIPNIDAMTSQAMSNISRTYCKQMDIFYSKSAFKETYRGCEVISVQNNFLNFTLFFVEKEATSSQIIGVIESSAKKVKNASQTFAVVDKFELELESVRVTMERRMEPETFNKKTLPDPVPTPKPSAPVIKDNPTPVKVTTPRIPNKVTPKDKAVYSWTPCEDGYSGSYFPHPTDCDKFFHCSNGVSIMRNCTEGNLYYWQELTCISIFTPDIECPDPNKAPPRPTTVKTTTLPTTTPTTKANKPETSVDPFYDDYYGDEVSTEGTTRPSRTPNNESKSLIAGKYPTRPKYSRTPCKKGADGRLYGHPDDCARFIQCVNGREMIMNCSGGLVFNPADNACIFPPNPELVCPDIRPCKDKDTGYFPHPYDCTKFIQCQSRKEVVVSCGDGLVWSPNVNSCIHDPNSPLCDVGRR